MIENVPYYDHSPMVLLPITPIVMLIPVLSRPENMASFYPTDYSSFCDPGIKYWIEQAGYGERMVRLVL